MTIPTTPRAIRRATLAVLAAMAGLGPASAQGVEVRRPYGENSSRELQLYDVREVVEASLQLPVDTPVEERDAAERSFVTLLATTMSRFVVPPLDGPEVITPVGASHVVAVGQPEQHAWVARFLDRQLRHAHDALEFTALVYSLTPERYDALGFDAEPRALDAETLAAFEAGLRDDEGELLAGVSVTHAPRLVCLPLSRVSVVIQDRTTYIADYRLHEIDVGGKRRVIADPVVEEITDGMSMEGTLLRADGGAIGFDFAFEQCELERPIPTQQVQLDPDNEDADPVTIQKPRVHEIAVTARGTAAPGSAVAFPSPEPLRGRRIVVLLQPAHFDDDAAPATEKRGG